MPIPLSLAPTGEGEPVEELAEALEPQEAIDLQKNICRSSLENYPDHQGKIHAKHYLKIYITLTYRGDIDDYCMEWAEDLQDLGQGTGVETTATEISVEEVTGAFDSMRAELASEVDVSTAIEALPSVGMVNEDIIEPRGTIVLTCSGGEEAWCEGWEEELQELGWECMRAEAKIECEGSMAEDYIED